MDLLFCRRTLCHAVIAFQDSYVFVLFCFPFFLISCPLCGSTRSPCASFQSVRQAKSRFDPGPIANDEGPSKQKKEVHFGNNSKDVAWLRPPPPQSTSPPIKPFLRLICLLCHRSEKWMLVQVWCQCNDQGDEMGEFSPSVSLFASCAYMNITRIFGLFYSTVKLMLQLRQKWVRLHFGRNSSGHSGFDHNFLRFSHIFGVKNWRCSWKDPIFSKNKPYI
jgi:hypothetical protein